MTLGLILLWGASVFVAFVVGGLCGWCLPYLSTALRLGEGLVGSFKHACREMTRDEDVIRRNTPDIIDIG